MNSQLSDGSYPIHVAATSGDIELIQLLYDKGANILARSSGCLPSTYARNNMHDEASQWLLLQVARNET